MSMVNMVNVVKALALGVLLSVSGCGASKGSRAAGQPVSLQPWLVGLTAVVGFLLIVFAILIINRLLKNRKEKKVWVYEKKEDQNEDKFIQTSM